MTRDLLDDDSTRAEKVAYAARSSSTLDYSRFVALPTDVERKNQYLYLVE